MHGVQEVMGEFLLAVRPVLAGHLRQGHCSLFFFMRGCDVTDEGTVHRLAVEDDAFDLRVRDNFFSENVGKTNLLRVKEEVEFCERSLKLLFKDSYDRRGVVEVRDVKLLPKVDFTHVGYFKNYPTFSLFIRHFQPMSRLQCRGRNSEF